MEDLPTFSLLRERADLTQEELSMRLHEAFAQIGGYKKISRKTISTWERGRHIPQLAPDETRIVCEVLRCSLEELAQATQVARQAQSGSS